MGKLKVAIVGCGRISCLHALGYGDNPDAEIALACDRDGGAATAFAGRFDVRRVSTSFAEVVADPSIDAVEILAPTELHEELAVRALEAGKHVHVQKPMATSLAGADRMLAAARKAGKILKVAENFVFFPPLVLAKRLIGEGAIGEVSSLRMKMISGGSGGWEVPDSAWAWRLKDFARGMGMNTFDHGHHMWASAWYLLGDFDAVEAWIDETNGIVDSPAVVQWRHRAPRRYGQCEFQYGKELSMPSPYYCDSEWFDVAGSRGVLTVNRGTAGMYEGPAVSVYAGGGWTHHECECDWAAGFAGSTRNFVDAILGRAAPLPSMEEGRHILAADIAIARSDRLCRRVYVEELDSPLPGLHAWRRRLQDRAGRRRFFASIAGKDGGARGQGARARELTLGLAERFRQEAAAGLEGEFGLVLGDPERGGGPYTLALEGGRVEIREAAPSGSAILTIRTSSDIWAGILLGKGRIETAYLRGKLRFDGEVTQALRLRDMFGL